MKGSGTLQAHWGLTAGPTPSHLFGPKHLLNKTGIIFFMEDMVCTVFEKSNNNKRRAPIH